MNGKLEKISVFKIALDKKNPRIARYVEMYGENPTPEQLSLALGVGEAHTVEDDGVSFHSLREAIRTNKGIIHPILVNKMESGAYTVIEGNTRLAIYLEFHKSKAEGDWAEIPCIVYEKLSDKEIDAIRLQAHLVGVRKWDPYSKAKYLASLRKCQYMTWNEIVDYCGGKQKEAEEYVDAFNDMEKYYREVLDDEASFDPTRFSAFVELQKPKIKDALLNAGFTLRDFATWVNDKTFSRLENIRRLPAILTNKKSKEAFLKTGDKTAVAVLDAPLAQSASSTLSLAELARLLAERLRKINLEEINKFKADPSSSDLGALAAAKGELESLFGILG